MEGRQGLFGANISALERVAEKRCQHADIERTRQQGHQANNSDNDPDRSSDSPDTQDNQHDARHDAGHPTVDRSHETDERVHLEPSLWIDGSLFILARLGTIPRPQTQSLPWDFNQHGEAGRSLGSGPSPLPRGVDDGLVLGLGEVADRIGLTAGFQLGGEGPHVVAGSLQERFEHPCDVGILHDIQ